MALILSGTHSSGPGLQYELYADQTGGSGNERTVKLTLKLKVAGTSSSSWFGYAMDHRFNVNGNWSGWATTKGTESWNATQGFRSWTYTYTTNVGTSGEKDITVGFQTDAKHSSNSWDTTKTGTFRVGKTNTAPTWPSGQNYLRIRPSKGSSTEYTGYYPENTTSLFLEWGQVSDSEGGTIEYSLNQSVNGGGYSRIDLGTDREHAHSINAGNEGQKLQFYVDAKDNGGMWSSKVYSKTITKNTLTGGSVHSATSINYNSSNFEVTVTAGRNTDGTAPKYRIYSDDLTVYNQTDNTGLKHTITIYKSGTVPSGPYIKFDDIKNRFNGSSYNGRFHIGVKTTNNYGTIKWSGGSVAVDIRTNPNPVTNQLISKVTTESTMYRKVGFNDNHYFLPDGSRVARVKWTQGSDKLGGTVTYELYVMYGSGSWQKLADLASGTTYYNHTIPKQSSKQMFKYLIRTKTSYGNQSDAQTTAEYLEYYNNPTIWIGGVVRAATTAEVKITVKTNSSIPNIGTVGKWDRCAPGTTTPVQQSKALTSSQSEQIAETTGLTDAGLYDFRITYNDNTGFSSGNAYYVVKIGANTAAFFVNKYGAGVNGVKANSSTALRVDGAVHPMINITGTTGYDSTPIGIGVAKTDADVNGFPGPYSTVLAVSESENRQFQIATNNTGANLHFRSAHVNNTAGTGTGWSNWNRIYHSGNKPSADELGMVALNGDSTMTGNLSFANDKGLSWRANGDGGDIYFHANNPSDASYLRYSVTDDGDEFHAFGGYHWDTGWSEWARIYKDGIRMNGGLEAAVVKLKMNSGVPCNEIYQDRYLNTSNNSSNRPRDYCIVRNFGGNGETNRSAQFGWYYGNGNEFYMRSQFDQNSTWGSWERLLTSGFCKNNNSYAEDGYDEGYVQLNTSTRLFYGWFSLERDSGGWAMRTYTIPNCTDIYGGTTITARPAVTICRELKGNQCTVQMYGMEGAEGNNIRVRYFLVGR